MKAATICSASDLRDLKRYEADSRWLHRRFDALRRKHPREFIAVYRRAIVAHARTLRALHALIRRRRPEADGRAAVEYLPQGEVQLIL